MSALSALEIYGLYDPRDDRCRYIGQTSKGTISRLSKHVTAVRIGAEGNTRKAAWFLELTKLELAPYVKILQTCFSADDLDAAEKTWISVHRAQGDDILNIAPGGHVPMLGCKHTAETKSRMSISAKNRSPESKARVAAAARNRTPITRRRISEALRGRTISVNTRLKMSSSARIKTISSIAKQNRLDAMKRPEVRAKISKAARGRTASQETRAKMSKSQLARWAKPSVTLESLLGAP